MSRRRYVSTEISVDTRVNRLAEQWGDFAALLYTWMIPHADDIGELSADPEQLLFTVIPGRRSRSANDVQQTIDGMLELGLMEIDVERGKLRFPADAFYRYQTYVKFDARRQSAGNAVNQRELTDNTVSVPIPPPVKDSHSTRDSVPIRAQARGASTARTFSESEEAKISAFVDELARRGAEHKPTALDRAAIADSPEAPAFLAEAFAAALAGRWGGPWLAENLEVRWVANKLPAYRLAKRSGFAKNGRTASADLTSEEQEAKYRGDGTTAEDEAARARRVLANNRATKETKHDRNNRNHGAGDRPAAADEIRPEAAHAGAHAPASGGGPGAET